MTDIRTNEIPYTGKLATPAVRLTAAKTTEVDLSGATLLYTAPEHGGFLTRLGAMPVASVTLCLLKFYLVKAATPTLAQFKRTRLMQPFSVSETVLRPEYDFGWDDESPLKLAGFDKLYVALGVAQAGGVDFAAEIEEFIAAAA